MSHEDASKRATMLLRHLSAASCSGESQDMIVNLRENESLSVINLVLNKPRSLNALSLPMVQTILTTIEAQVRRLSANPEASTLLILEACPGSKAFCAGGDIRSLAEASMQGKFEVPAFFFSTEYKMNAALGFASRMSDALRLKTVSLLDGITMGGGVGLSIYSSVCVVTEKLVFAMPETGIGFHPDIGGSFFLPRLPGSIGMYLALTGQRINAADALYCGIATHFCPSSSLPSLSEELKKMVSLDQIDQILGHFDAPLEQTSFLEKHRLSIDECFGAEGVVEIVQKLREHSDQQWAAPTLTQLLSKSPTSLFKAFESMKKGATQTLTEALQREFDLSMRFMHSHDFIEGVRAVLIEKDNKPRWNPPTIEEVASIQTDLLPDVSFPPPVAISFP